MKSSTYECDEYITVNCYDDTQFGSAKLYKLEQLKDKQKEEIELASNLPSHYFVLQVLSKQIILARFPRQYLQVEVVADNNYCGINAVLLGILKLGLPVRYSLFCCGDNDSLAVFQYKIRELTFSGEIAERKELQGNVCRGTYGRTRWSVGSDYEKDKVVEEAEDNLINMLNCEE